MPHQDPAHSRLRRALLAQCLLLSMLVVGCGQAPSAAPASRQEPGASPVRVAKTLRVGTTIEPKDGILWPTTGTGAQDPSHILHAGLTVYDEQGAITPRLAMKVPTIEDGDWTVGPDGRMEVTWRLRAGIKWHDGTPLTSDDLLLGLRVVQDMELPLRRDRWPSFVSEARRLDDTSFVVVWKQPYILANASGPSDVAALPAHLLGKLYDAGDKQAFLNSPYWTQEFVGAGPYRMKEWVLGSHMSVVAFDDYFLGRPKIDELAIRFFTDSPPLIAAALSGEVDVVPVGSMKAEEAVTLRRAWEPTGDGTAIISLNGLRVLYFQYRDTNAPWVRDVRVRRALANLQDRQTLVDTLKGGLTTVGHTLPTPNSPLYGLVEQRGLTKYDYDPRRAQQLLDEAGWTKGADGLVRNAAGQQLSIEVRTVIVAPEALQEILAESDQFKAGGLDSPVFQVRRGASDTSELRAKSEGVFSNRLDDTPDSFSRFHSSLIAGDANRWLGQNQFGYANPAFDRIYDQYTVTLEAGKRQSMLADILKTAADDVTFIPMWYELGLLNVAYRKYVHGPVAAQPVQQENMWNVHTWQMD